MDMLKSEQVKVQNINTSLCKCTVESLKFCVSVYVSRPLLLLFCRKPTTHLCLSLLLALTLSLFLFL